MMFFRCVPHHRVFQAVLNCPSKVVVRFDIVNDHQRFYPSVLPMYLRNRRTTEILIPGIRRCCIFCRRRLRLLCHYFALQLSPCSVTRRPRCFVADVMPGRVIVLSDGFINVSQYRQTCSHGFQSVWNIPSCSLLLPARQT